MAAAKTAGGDTHFPKAAHPHRSMGCWATAWAALLTAIFLSPEVRAQEVFGSPFYDFEVVVKNGDLIEGESGSPAYPLHLVQIPASVNDEGEVAAGGFLIDPGDADGDRVDAVIGWRPGDTAARYLNGFFEFQPNPQSKYGVQLNNDGHVVVTNAGLIHLPAAVPTEFFPIIFGIQVDLYDIDQGGVHSPTSGDGPLRVVALPGHDGSPGFPNMPGRDDLPITVWSALANDGSAAYNLHNIVNGLDPSGSYSLERRLYVAAPVATDGGTLVSSELHFASPIMVGDGKRVVYRSGTNPTDGIFYSDPMAGGPQKVAGYDDWDLLHSAPAISDDGKAIVWWGRRDGVDGIWVRIFDPVTDALEAVPLITTETPISFDDSGDSITFSSFTGTGVDYENENSRVNIIRHDKGGDGSVAGDSFTILFPGKPSSASKRNAQTGGPLFFSDQMGLWTMRFTVEEGYAGSGEYFINTEGVMPVIQVGDRIGMETVDNFYIWDGLARGAKGIDGSDRQVFPSDHYLAFFAETSTGVGHIIRASHLDDEGDGLPNHWERNGGGIDIDRDGEIDLDLHAMGADPAARDLFVEVDWTGRRREDGAVPSIWTTEPNPTSLGSVAAAFFLAPGSPAGEEPAVPEGITLHIDAGDGFDAAGIPFSQNMPDDGDLLQGGDLVRIPFTSRRPDIVYMGEEKPSLLGSGFSSPAIASFQALKQRYFGTTDKGARELAFRYAILADFQDFADFVRPQGGVTDVPLVAETATRSKLTTPGGLDGDGDGRAELPRYADSLAWVMVESTTSGGPFQLREVQSIVDLAGGAIEVTISGAPFHPVPEPGANFAFLHTSSGRAEIAFQRARPGGDDENFNTLPGNDFLITTAGLETPWVFRRQRFVTIGPFFRNTFIHELGHTLGLQHGGINGCRYRADDYFSLMSYSHQLRACTSCTLRKHDPPDTCTSNTRNIIGSLGGTFPLFHTYSDGMDPLGATTGHSDWAAIKTATYRNFLWLGNTSLSYGGDARQRDLHPDGPPPIDRAFIGEAPEITLVTPAPGDTIPTGSPYVVEMDVTDALHGIAEVAISFDVDGDGLADPTSEVFPAAHASGSRYEAILPAPSGDSGGRTLQVVATNDVGLSASVAPSVWTGSGSPGDTSPPSMTIRMPSLGGRSARGYSFGVEIFPSEESIVVVRFDADGDGVVNPGTEHFEAIAGEGGIYLVEVGPVSGPLGNRTIEFYGEDLWRNSRVVTRDIEVIEPDTVPPMAAFAQPAGDVEASLGIDLEVSFTASDDIALSDTRATFDIDGDGEVEIFNAEDRGGGLFRVVLRGLGFGDPPGIYGPEGPRELTIEAFDDWGNRSSQSLTVNVLDRRPPDIFVAQPRENQAIVQGETLIVTHVTSDDGGLASVRVSFDANGDGDTDDFNEEQSPFSAVSGVIHRPFFPAVSGPDGVRVITFEAEDLTGKVSTAMRMVHVGSRGVLTYPDGRLTIPVGYTAPVVYEAPQGVTVDQVTVWFDTDGDGRVEAEERFAMTDDTLDGQFRGSILAAEGEPGLRPLQVSLVDDLGNETILMTSVEVMAGDRSSGMFSEFLARVPMIPERYAGSSIGASAPENLIVAPPYVVFSARHHETGRELWRTDGSSAGTSLVVDGYPIKEPTTSEVWPLRNLGNSFELGRNMAIFEGEVYFTFNDRPGAFGSGGGPYGIELWKVRASDGEPQLVRDIRPGTGSGDPEEFAVFNGRLWFYANDGTGRRLWSSDGTTAGTRPEHDRPGSGGALEELVAAGDYLYFTQGTLRLWRTDGTPEGLLMLRDFQGPGILGTELVHNLRAFGDKIVFEGRLLEEGREPWVSDGTIEGTRLLRDIGPTTPVESPEFLGQMDGVFFFTQLNGEVGRELWKTDGTPEGTLLVKDIHRGLVGSNPSGGVIFGGRFYFAADDGVAGKEVWSTDGSGAGTRLEADIFPGPRSGDPTGFVVFRDEIYFAANSLFCGRELFAIDGAGGMPRLVADIVPGSFWSTSSSPSTAVPRSSSPAWLTVLDDRLIFAAGELGLDANVRFETYRELWSSDGTAAGTRILRNIQKRNAWSLESWNGDIYLAASHGGSGYELFQFKIATNALSQLADLFPGVDDSYPSNFRDLGSQALFTTQRPTGISGTSATFAYQFGRTDGTVAGTSVASETFSGIFHLTGPVAGRFYFSPGGSTAELWATDGTDSGTGIVREIRAGFSGSLPSEITAFNGGVIFSATDGLTGRELWFSDGTEVGTEQVIDLQPGSASSSPQLFAVRDGVLLFFASTSPDGWRLWKTDGTAANTEVVADVGNPNLSAGVPGFAYNHFTTFQGYHYFAGYTSDEADELWRTDGTTGGTELVKILRPGSFGSRPGQFTVVGNKLFFTAVTSAGEELWVTDGTPAGTVGPIEIAGGTEGSAPRDLIAIGDRLVFTAFNGNRGREWFASDGTFDGTILLRDIREGSLNSYILEPTPLGNEVFFTADDGIHGRELWRTDGTPEGTEIVEDLLAGPSSSSPQKLLALDGMLYYFADDGGEMLSLRRLDPGVTTPLDKWLDDTSDLAGEDRAPTADPNNNNQSTLFDYATGVDADDPEAGSVEVFTLSQPDAGRMLLRFPRWRDRDQRRLSYDLEFSLDGNNWTPVSLEDAPVRVLSEDFEEVSIEVDCSPDTGMTRALFHLRISQGEW